MNRQELARLVASLTDDELEELRNRGQEDTAAREDPTSQFLRAVKAEQGRDWLSEVAERLGLPTQTKPSTFTQVFTADDPTNEL